MPLILKGENSELKGFCLDRHAVLQQKTLKMQQSIAKSSNIPQKERKNKEKITKNVDLKLAWKLLYI